MKPISHSFKQTLYQKRFYQILPTIFDYYTYLFGTRVSNNRPIIILKVSGIDWSESKIVKHYNYGDDSPSKFTSNPFLCYIRVSVLMHNSGNDNVSGNIVNIVVNGVGKNIRVRDAYVFVPDGICGRSSPKVYDSVFMSSAKRFSNPFCFFLYHTLASFTSSRTSSK